MRDLIEIVGYVNLAAYTALGLLAIRQWATRRDRAAVWAALAFAALGVVSVVGFILPQTPHTAAEKIAQRLDIAVLVVFPFLLYRFTVGFTRTAPRVERFVTSMTALLVVWTFALPHFPAEHEPRSALFNAYLAAFLLHWTVLTVLVAWRLWGAGRSQPSVARRRMRMLAFAAATITLAIFAAAASGDSHSGFALATALLASISAVAFLLGLAPPYVVRLLWRRPEQERLQRAIETLMTRATSRAEVVERVLPPMLDLVGARAVELCDSEGCVLGTHSRDANPDAMRSGKRVDVELEDGSVSVWTTPYAPYFGAEEFQLLRTLGALTMLALDRVRLTEHELETRRALERADEVKTNFVALAAHELRTPVAAIQGVVQTLEAHRARLRPDQLESLNRALVGQTRRLSLLLEQLLDLSRLDADAMEIKPERFHVRERVEEVVLAAAPDNADAVSIDVPAGLEALIDPEAFDRILTNLVTNAFRYGAPPVLVSAEQRDRHFRLSVEDRGTGVTAEFAPNLFERFARSDESRQRVAAGTGLGLAIARSYAQAHDGDLVYEDATPSGARFCLVLPSPPAE
ncbi:MAG: hypothetical protein QOE36_1658 [Gaiellaceae bacterium]|jgi:signal transduction histidine kinase|nr:hypothetical protein [Gaiellaceae bacterium]